MTLTKKIKNLEEIFAPEKEWLEKSRKDLLFYLKNNYPAKKESLALKTKPLNPKFLANQFQQFFGFLFSFYPRTISLVIAIFCLLISGGGMVLASVNSLPGDALYPVKIVGEKVDLALHSFSPKAKTDIRLKILEKRFKETQILSEKIAHSSENQPKKVALQNLLDSLSEETNKLNQVIQKEGVSQYNLKETTELNQKILQKTIFYKEETKNLKERLPIIYYPQLEKVEKNLTNSSLQALTILTLSAQIGLVEPILIKEGLEATIRDFDQKIGKSGEVRQASLENAEKTQVLENKSSSTSSSSSSFNSNNVKLEEKTLVKFSSGEDQGLAASNTSATSNAASTSVEKLPNFVLKPDDSSEEEKISLSPIFQDNGEKQGSLEPTSSQAAAWALEQAKNYLNAKDYLQALAKVQEGVSLLNSKEKQE